MLSWRIKTVKRECARHRSGETLIDLLMSWVVPIVGMTAGTMVLKSWTPLPLWACALIAMPFGILAQVMVLGIFFLLDRIFGSGRKQRGD
jgi:hypothetical protein